MKDRHIWEGWTVDDFISALTPTFDMIMHNASWRSPFTSEEELKQWCKDNQPYYKKHIPEVFAHFKKQLKIKEHETF